MKILAVPTHLGEDIQILRMDLALGILKLRVYLAGCLSWRIRISPRILKLTSKLKLLGG
jgi:hypothetical protein